MFVQEVIAAIKIEPSLTSYFSSLTLEIENSFLFVISIKLFLKNWIGFIIFQIMVFFAAMVSYTNE